MIKLIMIFLCGIIIGTILGITITSEQEPFEGIADIKLCNSENCTNVGVYRITGYDRIYLYSVQMNYSSYLLQNCNQSDYCDAKRGKNDE